MEFDTKSLLSFLNEAAKPVKYADIIKSLKVKKDDAKEFDIALNRLLKTGEIVKLKDGRYGLPSKMNLVVGKVQVHPDGYGFIIPDDASEEEDLYVRPRQLKEVMHGDTVIARKQISNRTKKTEGKIIRIVKRGNTNIIGRFEKKRKFGYLVPLSPSILHDIYIPIEDSMDAPNGIIATAQIKKYPTKHLNPEGVITKVLGDINDPSVEIESILHKHQIKSGFPKNVMDLADSMTLDIGAKELEKRVDLREHRFFTIDGETAKDFDDAVCIKREKSGYKLFVAIADVSHYVKQDSPLDIEAFTRATSVYLLDKVVPMLPEKLSNDICSLRPDEDRFTFTVEMEFDSLGDLVDYAFYKSVINSKRRMTYTQVKQVLSGKNKKVADKYADIAGDLQAMRELAMILREKRALRGSIDFDLPEADIIIDLRGQPENIIKAERNIAHKIIEEFMLAANETVATHLSWLDVPSIYRVHEEPAQEKLADFRELVFNLGYQLKVTSKIHPKALAQLLAEVEDAPEAMLINRVMLRTMQQAKYMTTNQGHFALATSNYTHFTSPIRRYPDMVVHRILANTLANKKFMKKQQAGFEAKLTKITDHCSRQERVAEAAEREIISLKKVQFMVDKVGDTFSGFISGVTSFGFFVELCDIFVEGLVHISALKDDYYQLFEKEHMLVGTNLKKIYRLGDMVSVKLVRASVEKREIDFELIKKIK